MISPFQASKNGPKGRSKSSRKDKTNESPPVLRAVEVESRAVMVKLALLPAVIMDNAPPVTTLVDAHVMLVKSNVWANELNICPNNISRHAELETSCELDNRFIL